MWWFAPNRWWTHVNIGWLLAQGISGLQVLAAPLGGDPELPPVDVARRWVQATKVTVHPTFPSGPLEWTTDMKQAVRDLGVWLEHTGVRDVVLHADHLLGGEVVVRELLRLLPPIRLHIENMGSGKQSGTTIAEIRDLLKIDSDFGFVLDIAHLCEIGAEGELACWLNDGLLAERLTMVHVSSSGKAFAHVRARCAEPLRAADHLPAFLNESYPQKTIWPLLARVPLVCEGCLPSGPDGALWLKREVGFLAEHTFGVCHES